MGMHYEDEKRWTNLALAMLEHLGTRCEKIKFDFP